jgi:hypothetical protein
MYRLRRWRPLVAILLALFAVVATGAEAFANPTGESSYFQPELANNQQVYASSSVSEARNTVGYTLDAWRGADNNSVWVSLRNGSPYQIGTTATYFSPTVVPFGQGFAVFHVGVDARIYWSYTYSSTPDPGSWSPWNPVPDGRAGGYQTTWNAVGVAQLGPGSTVMYLVYRSSSGDNVIWGDFFDGSQWYSPVDTGGRSYSAPGITWNNVNQQLIAGVRGTDNSIWISRQPIGQGWLGWYSVGGGTYDAPAISAAANGTTVLAATDQNQHVWFDTLNTATLPTQTWSQESTGWQASATPSLSANPNNDSVYLIFTGKADDVWWKQAFHQ